MNQRSNELEPTTEQLSQQLLALGIDETMITQAVQQATVKQEQDRSNEAWASSIDDLAAAHKRTTGSDSNIEGIYEWLSQSAVNVLELAAKRVDKSELDDKAIQAAALTYVYMELEHPYEPLDLQLFRDAGIAPEWVLSEYRTAITLVYNPVSLTDRQAQLDRLTNSFEAFKHFTGWTPVLYKTLLVDRLDELHADLLKAGHKLPVLKKNGKYADEDQDED